MTTNQANGLLKYIAAAFPQSKALDEEATVAVYLSRLLPMPYERTRAAVEHLVDTAEFLPSVAQLLGAAGIESDADRDLLHRAMQSGQPLNRDYVHGWVVGEPRNPIPPPAERPALPAPDEEKVDIRPLIARLAAALRGAK